MFIPVPKSITPCISFILLLFERSFIQNTISSFNIKFPSNFKTVCIQLYNLKIFHLDFTKSMTVLIKANCILDFVMDLYTLNIPVGAGLSLNCELDNIFKGLAVRLDLLIVVEKASDVLVLGLAFILLSGFACEIKVGIKRDFFHQMLSLIFIYSTLLFFNWKSR